MRPDCQVFIGGLERTTSEDEVRAFVAGAGVAVEAVRMHTKHGESRYAFATLASPADVQRALTMLAGCPLRGRVVDLGHGLPRRTVSRWRHVEPSTLPPSRKAH